MTPSGPPNSHRSDIFFLNTTAQQRTMAGHSNEANIILAIQAIKENPKLGIRQATSDYNISRTTLQRRMNGITARRDTIANSRTMTESEEQIIVNYVLDLDSREFPPTIAHVEDMANNLGKCRDATRVGTRWAYRFISRRLELKTRWNRP
jgi:hypothetical protein